MTAFLCSVLLRQSTSAFLLPRFFVGWNPAAASKYLPDTDVTSRLLLRNMSDETDPSRTSTNWEPLPPRGSTSSRERRRKARMEAVASSSLENTDNSKANDTVHDKAESPKNRKQTKPTRKPNRPGYNSYLKVILDDESLERLHNISVSIQRRVEDSQKDEFQEEAAQNDKDQTTNVKDETYDGKEEPQTDAEQDNTAMNMETKSYTAAETQRTSDQNNKDNNKESSKMKKKPVKYKPRSRASLHMTFFFGGEALCELPAEELVEWHGKIRDRLKESGFVLAAEAGKEAEAEEVARDVSVENLDEYWFNITDICTFPPQRNNLVVAILEASPAWHQLHNDVRDIAKNGNIQALKNITTYSKEKWTAHITLGNIFGGGRKREVTKFMTEILQDIRIPDKDTAGEGARTHVHGISMGGPVPEQVELPWDFTFVPKLAQKTR